MRRILSLLIPCIAFCGLHGCFEENTPHGLRKTPAGDGPRVIFNPTQDRMPYPSDLSTRIDLKSPTGKRLNISQNAATAFESQIRSALLDLDGFATSGVISVSFDAPLSVSEIVGKGRPFHADPVLIVDLTEGSTFGERIPLDLGRGAYPLAQPQIGQYGSADPRANEENLLFETADEDLNGDGVLQKSEDSDGDGLLDRPNCEGQQAPCEIVDFYEYETHTLILRPLEPLRPGHLYAVVLTDDLRGEKGPVHSPFEFIHHTQQTDALEFLPTALAMHNLSIDRVAFTWTFTTQSSTRLLEEAASQIGTNPHFGSDAFPPVVSWIDRLKQNDEEAAILHGNELQILSPLWGSILNAGESDIEVLAPQLSNIDRVISGRFSSPLLADEETGQFPSDLKKLGDLQSEEVSFWCFLPSAEVLREDVVLFAHDFGGSRLNALPYAAPLNAAGLTVCAFDTPRYGLTALPDMAELLGEEQAEIYAPLKEALLGRNQFESEPSQLIEVQPSLSPIQARDMTRQLVMHLLKFKQVLQGFDGGQHWGQRWISSGIAGDFDDDGWPDFGGPDARYHLLGVGYGGQLATIAGTLDPQWASVAALSTGGSISDELARSVTSENVVTSLMGPLIVGWPTSSTTWVGFEIPDSPLASPRPRSNQWEPFAELPSLEAGDQVAIHNLTNGRSSHAYVDQAGQFRLSVPADAGDALRFDLLSASGEIKSSVDRFEITPYSREPENPAALDPLNQPLTAMSSGFGIARQTPTFRQILQELFPLAYAPAEPLDYARKYREDDSPRFLLALNAGDPEAPVANGLTLARAAGLLQTETLEGMLGEQMQILIDQHVVLGASRLHELVDFCPISKDWASDDLNSQNERDDGGSALRILYSNPEGAHGFDFESDAENCPNRYMHRLLVQFFTEGSTAHRSCLGSKAGCD